MAEPKKRLSTSRSGNRRSHLAKQSLALSICPKCKSHIIPHRICKVCGTYKGNDILKLEEKARAKELRRKEREKEDNK